ncbi:MAG: radical SAM/SPASM domain-containing protein [Bdellovibrionota bacterium]
MQELISLPKEINYIAAFLTLSCNYKCSYCINHPENECLPRPTLAANAWVKYLNRLTLPVDLPITFQGGEPTQYPGFYDLIAGLNKNLRVDLLTNLSFDVEQFVKCIPPSRFYRSAPYAPIRVTYHPGQVKIDELLEKLIYLKEQKYPIGLYSIRIPGTEKLIENLKIKTTQLGIDYRTKEFLGTWRGKILGDYHYDGGLFSKNLKKCICRTSEFLIGPDGSVYRCHRDLYRMENPIGNILEGEYQPHYMYRPCDKFGDCNPCDLKRKTNRFQQDGHASVEIQFKTSQTQNLSP